MKQALVIYNPVSGHKKWGDLPSFIKKTLEKKGYEYTWYETKPHQDLSALFHKKHDCILVCGGDGTVAEVVQAMVQTQVKTPLMILPQGSANILAFSLGIPLFPLRRALEKGFQSKARNLDVMRVNGTHYAMIAVGRGYDAFLMQNTTRELKRKLGLLAYAWVFLKTAFFYRSHPYRLNIDGQRSSVMARSIMVFNLSPLPLLKIDPEDGLLNVLVLTSKGILESYTGKKISIKTNHELKFQLDGEVLKSKAVNIEVVPKAIPILCKK